jgi:hypothetical protein
LEAAIEAAAKEIVSMKVCLNEWDSKVGDGDCGATVSPLSCFTSLFISTLLSLVTSF